LNGIEPFPSPTDDPGPVLCAPFPETVCFGCCPPIRPPGYDPLDHVGSLRRELSDNRARFLRQGPRSRPVVGYHCWALGFLDAKGRRAGCLLHPARNEGRDLRDLTGYGDKCRREFCLPARMFRHLSREEKGYWLSLARGLGPFHYSSRRANPLFHLLLWGPPVLGTLGRQGRERGWTATELMGRLPFLLSRRVDPRERRYTLALAMEAVSWKGERGFREVESLEASLRRWARENLPPLLGDGPDGSAVFVHQLPVSPALADFLRFGLHRPRLSWEQAVAVEEAMEDMMRRL